MLRSLRNQIFLDQTVELDQVDAVMEMKFDASFQEEETSLEPQKAQQFYDQVIWYGLDRMRRAQKMPQELHKVEFNADYASHGSKPTIRIGTVKYNDVYRPVVRKFQYFADTSEIEAADVIRLPQNQFVRLRSVRFKKVERDLPEETDVNVASIVFFDSSQNIETRFENFKITPPKEESGSRFELYESDGDAQIEDPFQIRYLRADMSAFIPPQSNKRRTIAE